MRLFILAALAAAATLTAATAQDAPGKCGPLPDPFEGLAFAGDGDNVYALGPNTSFRLWGVQAPELRDKTTSRETIEGMRARAALDDLLDAAGHKVTCSPRKFDRFCRVVATCTAGAADLSLELLRQGMAYGFWLADAPALDSAPSLAYAGAEAEARKQRRGLWKDWLGER